MTTTSIRRPDPSPAPASRPASDLALRAVGAVLAVAVAYIHVKDQGGLPGDKTPGYVGAGYWLLELTGVLLAAALLTGRRTRSVWLLVLGIGAGPLAGFVLSRGPGLPGYTDDKGNWTEPLGLVSIAVELILLAVAVWALLRSTRSAPSAGTQVA